MKAELHWMDLKRQRVEGGVMFWASIVGRKNAMTNFLYLSRHYFKFLDKIFVELTQEALS